MAIRIDDWEAGLPQQTVPVTGDKVRIDRAGAEEMLDVGDDLLAINTSLQSRILGREAGAGTGRVYGMTSTMVRALLGMSTTSLVTFGNVSIDGAAGTSRTLFFRSSGSPRWTFQLDAITESGSDVGSNISLSRRNDAGTELDRPINVIRSTGIVSMTQVAVTSSFSFPPKTFATLPTASGATGQTFRVTDRNHRQATSDGTNWRYGDNSIAV